MHDLGLVIWKCPNCGRIMRGRTFILPVVCHCGLRDEIGEHCQVEGGEVISLFGRIPRYIDSTEKWINAGKPERTDEEVEQIIKICKGCPGKFYEDGICTHSSCGCNVRSVNEEKKSWFGVLLGVGMINKIRRKTEVCPAGYWS